MSILNSMFSLNFSHKYVCLIQNYLVLISLLGSLLGYHCNVCPKWFASQKTLSRHKMWHHKSPNQHYRFNCKQCPYSSNEKTNYEVHLAVHKSDRSHQCPYCGNGFTSVGSLNKHIIIHTGEDERGFIFS